MKAIVVRNTGDPDVLRVEERERPVPGLREVRIRHEAVGVNFIDIYERAGAYAVDVPFVPAREAAGIVDGVGTEVDDLRVGDRVAYGTHRGAAAECAIVPAAKVVPVPEAVGLDVAAAVMLQGMTAHYLSRDTYELRPEDSALVHAAAGGVGLLLVQMAHRAGARVIGTVSTEEKAELARRAGADHVVRYTETDFLAEVGRLTGGRGVSVVYDSVGRDTFERSLACLRPRGMMVLYGQSSGPVGALDPQVLNSKGSLFLTRPSLRHHVADRDELLRRSRDLFDWIVDGSLDVRIDRAFPLAEAAEAHRYMEGRKTRGKILLVP